MDGRIDEARISNIVRTACWVDGQHETSNAPGDIGVPNFYTVGTEDPSPLTFADVTTFTAEMASEDGVRLQWRTTDEINNLGFHVYREENGQRVRVTPAGKVHRPILARGCGSGRNPQLEWPGQSYR
jgi:hypothetical protein